MIEPATLTIFVGACLAILFTPGPAVLYIVARSIDQGRTAGLVSAAGLGVGALVHVAAAATGLAALLAASETAFVVVKYAGAGYLVFLGLRRLRAGGETPEAAEGPDRPGEIFVQGIVVNLTNPKAVVFILAFLPQFVSPTGNEAAQIVQLGLVLIGLGLVTDALWAVAAGALRRRLLSGPRSRRATRVFSALVLVALGVFGLVWPVSAAPR